jgi:hypothetical protein
MPLILLLAAQVTVDVSETPELKDWAAKARALCEEWYPKASEALSSEGFAPPREIRIVFQKDKKGVADTVGNVIRVAADWVKKRPDDLGMIIHEMVHVVQSYPGGACPGWVTEGVADYVRYFLYEKKEIYPKERRTGKHTDAYRTTASFFAWLEGGRAPGIVRKLNAAARSRTYSDALFKDAAGKDVADLWKDYAAGQP